MKNFTYLLVALISASVACARPGAGDSPSAPAIERQVNAAPAQAASTFDQTHAAWTTILAAHVRGTNFDYGALAKDKAALTAYTQSLRAVTAEELASFTKDERYAFWINAYNAFTIQLIVDNYPLKSIRKLDSGLFGSSSIFDSEFIPLNALHPDAKDEQLSLNDIEHEILRKRFKDARVHAAVNCASASCPPLLNEAFTGAKLQKQLDAQMIAFVNDTVRNQFIPKPGRQGEVRLSKIFDWFKSDFQRDANSVRAYLLRYSSDEHGALFEKALLRHTKYDWDLNDHRTDPAK